MFGIFISLLWNNQTYCLGNKDEGDRQFVLLKNDYQIISNNEGYLALKILNEDMINKLFETVYPIIIIHINGEEKISKGMYLPESSLPLHCDYIFQIDINTKKAVFDNSRLLILTSIDNYIAQKMKNYENRENILLLEPYTSYKEVIDRFGEPDFVVGSGLVIIQYKLQDGRKLNLNFGRGDVLYVLDEISIQDDRKVIFDMFINQDKVME